jgi:two-component system, chemotaxis family, protein-glutamate methylesterase/glutaminase
MPVMTGLDATEYIMAHCPTPILVVSASTNRGELFRTYDALRAGALDVLEKPLGDRPDGEWERKLIAAVKLISRIRVITHPRARLPPGMVGSSKPLAVHPVNGDSRRAGAVAVLDEAPHRVIALGVSTGGPGALHTILSRLPADFPIPILVVLHLARAFAGAFAEWLQVHSKLPVSYARDGQVLPDLGRGEVILAPPDRHLLLRGGRLRLTEAPERHSCRPSIDVLFESLAQEKGSAVMACLLTGMGRDGAAGLLALRQAGASTCAQDEATSVVFGMPREAILLGAAQQVLPLGDFPNLFIELGRRAARRVP